MSVYFTHIIRPVDENIDLMNKLKKDGLVHDMNGIGFDKNVHDYTLRPCKDMLDYSKCNPEAYEEIKKRELEKRISVGVPCNDTKSIERYVSQGYEVDEKSKEHGYVHVVRDFKDGELEAVLSRHIYKNHNGIAYALNYRTDDTAIYLITKTYPDITFEYILDGEHDIISKGTLKDGKFEEEPKEYYIAALNEKNTGVSGYIKMNEDSFELVKDYNDATKTNDHEEILTVLEKVKESFNEKYGEDYSLHLSNKNDWQLMLAVDDLNNEFEQANDERDDI